MIRFPIRVFDVQFGVVYSSQDSRAHQGHNGCKCHGRGNQNRWVCQQGCGIKYRRNQDLTIAGCWCWHRYVMVWFSSSSTTILLVQADNRKKEEEEEGAPAALRTTSASH
jgi:hypothetical protein